jgi:hypothetical protein
MMYSGKSITAEKIMDHPLGRIIPKIRRWKNFKNIMMK